MANRIHVSTSYHDKPSEAEAEAYSVRTFTERTTMHGCQSLMQPDYHVIRRVMWVVLMLVSTGFFLNAFIRGISRYRSYPSSISVDIQPSTDLSLPDISVCNNNLLRQSFLETQSTAVRDTIAAIFGQTQSPPPEIANSIGYADLFLRAMDPLDRFITQCSVGFVPFECSQFIEKSLTWTGACYTFNLVNFTITEPSPFAGLRFEISLNESEYSDHVVSSGMGVKLIFNEHGEFPDESWQVNLQPDTDVHVAVQKSQNIRLGTPYSTDDCLEDKGDYSLYPVYTKRGCQLECLNEYYREKVACDFIKTQGLRNCTIGETYEHFANSTLYTTEECACLRPCRETTFTSDVTSLAYRGTKSSQHVKKISLTVYYPTFDVKIVTQEASYDFNSFIADVGGQMGFFLGASILTLSEMLEFVILYTVRKLKMN